MQPQTTSASPFTPTATPSSPSVPAYKPVNLQAYDSSINADPNQSSADIQSAFSKFQASKKNPLDVYNDAVNQLGVGDVRTRVQNLRTQLLNTENLLNGVDGSVTGRTQGSLVTEAQRQRLVNLERAPIMQDYGKMSGSLNNENATLSDLLGQAQSQSQLAVQGASDRENAIKFALEQATRRETDAEDRRRFELQLQMARDKASQDAKNSLSAIAAKYAQPPKAAPSGPAPSQQQVNAAMWLQQNGGAGNVSNYKSQPVDKNQFLNPLTDFMTKYHIFGLK